MFILVATGGKKKKAFSDLRKFLIQKTCNAGELP